MRNGSTITGPLKTTHSVLASEEVAQIINAHFPVTRVADCYLLRRGFNEVYLVRCENGAKFVARLSAIRARGPANIDYEVSLLIHLASKGAGVAEVLRPTSGGSCVDVPMPEGPRPLALFKFVEGSAPATLEDIEFTGCALAGLHMAAEGYAGPPSRFKIDADHLLHRPLEWLLSAPTVDDDLRARFSDVAAMLDSNLAERSGLSIAACHGDCHGGNNFIRIQDDGARGNSFFDFDDSAPGYLSYDLAVFLWSQLLRKSLAAPDDEAAEKWHRFLRGYESQRKVETVDIDAIPLFVGMRHFWFLGEYASRRAQWGSEALPVVWLRKQADLLRSWQELKGMSL